MSDLFSPCCNAPSACGDVFFESDSYECSACKRPLVVMIDETTEVENEDGEPLSRAYLVDADPDDAERADPDDARAP